MADKKRGLFAFALMGALDALEEEVAAVEASPSKPTGSLEQSLREQGVVCASNGSFEFLGANSYAPIFERSI